MKTFRRIWKYGRNHPGLLTATFAAAVLSTLANLIPAKATGSFVDNVLIHRRADLLLPFVVIVFGSALLRDTFNMLRIIWNNTFEQKVILDLRCDLYATLQALPLRWYDQRATGDIATRVIDDVAVMQRVLIDGVEQGIVAVVQIVGVSTILFFMNARLAACLLIPMPPMLAGVIWYTATAHQRYREQRRAASYINALLIDNLQGVRQIKSFAREKPEYARFSDGAKKAGFMQLAIMRVWSRYSSVMSALVSLGSAIVLYIGGLDVLLHPGFTPGQLVTFMFYVGMLFSPVSQLHQINQIYQAARASTERVGEILDETTEDYGADAGEVFPRAKGEVRYEHVNFSYRPDVPALEDIDVAVKPGLCVALVGPTGAGKSTLVSLLSRFYQATGGAITLDGRDVRDMPLRELREQVGVVSQETFLFNGSIIENLRFGREDATREEIETAARAACVHDFAAALPEGYDTHVGERGVKLSGGEMQRISIARALLKDPPVLVLDEATASVDTVTEQLIQKALQRLLKGRTSFVIAHRLSTVRHADLILVLKEGRIVERGTHDELLALDGLYARLCHAQATDRFSEDEVGEIFSER